MLMNFLKPGANKKNKTAIHELYWFESNVIPEINEKQNPNESYTNKYQNYISCNFDYKLVCVGMINFASIEYFKSILYSVHWNLITQPSTADSSYNIFLHKFVKLYDIAFPERKSEIKLKKLLSHWITRGFKKSWKGKQRLYEKFLKHRNDKNEKNKYKNLFKKLKVQSKKLYFQNTLHQYENNVKNTWKIMKIIIG